MCTEILVKFGHVVSDICSRTERHKRDTPIAISLVQGGEMKMWTRNERSRVVSACSEGTISFPLVVGKGSPCSVTERRVPELIPVLGSQPAGDVSRKPGGRLPLLSARPAVTPAVLKRAATSFAA